MAEALGLGCWTNHLHKTSSIRGSLWGVRQRETLLLDLLWVELGSVVLGKHTVWARAALPVALQIKREMLNAFCNQPCKSSQRVMFQMDTLIQSISMSELPLSFSILSNVFMGRVTGKAVVVFPVLSSCVPGCCHSGFPWEVFQTKGRLITSTCW